MSMQRVRDAGRLAMGDRPREEPWPILVKVAQDKVELVSSSNKTPIVGSGTTKSR